LGLLPKEKEKERMVPSFYKKREGEIWAKRIHSDGYIVQKRLNQNFRQKKENESIRREDAQKLTPAFTGRQSREEVTTMNSPKGISK